jgi:membrane protease YdiL (CAAX protease family)
LVNAVKLSVKQLTVQIFVILFLLLFPHYVPLPFYSYAIICMVVILIYLKNRGKTLRNLGLKKNGFGIGYIIVGLVSALLWVAFNKWIYHPIIIHFFNVADYTEYDFIRKKFFTLIITIIAAWVVGGFYEEIVFRGFIQTTLQQWFQKQKHAFWLAGLVTSMLFGLYHWQQGIFGMVPSFLGGLLWTFLLKRYKGNLWYSILSHAIYDTIALILIYFKIVI